MRPILCGGYYHAPRWSLRNYEVTDCPPPEEVRIYGHDPRSGLAMTYVEVRCRTCSERRHRIKNNLPKPEGVDFYGRPLSD